jgi:hypothetical protein
VQGVHRLLEVLGTYQLRWRVEGLLLQKCTESRDSNTQKYLKVAARSASRILFRDLKLSEKLRRVSAFEVFKGREVKLLCRRRSQYKGTLVHFAEVQGRNRVVEILCGESPK